MRPATVQELVVIAAALMASSVRGAQVDPAAKGVIRIGPEVHITKGFEKENFREPHIIALPTEPPSLVAVSFRWKAPPGPGLRSDCVIFVSPDSGLSWSLAPGGTLQEARICVDPWLARDEDGAVFLSYLGSFEETDSDFRLGARIRRSVDGGMSWSEPIELPLGDARGYDKPSITVDSSPDSPHRGNVYVHAAAGTRRPSGERIRWIAVS